MDIFEHDNNPAAEIIPAPDKPAVPEKTDSSADAANKGQNGNPAQSAGRVTSQEQDAAPSISP